MKYDCFVDWTTRHCLSNSPKWFIFCDAWHNHDSWPTIINDLNAWISFIIGCTACAWDWASGTPFAFISKSEGFRCWLLCYLNVSIRVWMISGVHCCARINSLSIGYCLRFSNFRFWFFAWWTIEHSLRRRIRSDNGNYKSIEKYICLI